MTSLLADVINTSKRSVRPLLSTVFALPGEKFDLGSYLSRRQLPPEAEQYLRNTFARPATRPNGYMSQTIHYPCSKLGHALVFHSKDIEFANGLSCIYRADVLCAKDQPDTIYPDCPTPGWKEYTPDLMLITTGGVEIIEAKPSSELAKLCLERPERYQEKNGVYTSGEFAAHFRRWGFSFRIVTEHDIHKRFVRAILHLHPFFSGSLKTPPSDSEIASVLTYVKANPSCFVSELPLSTPGRRAEVSLHLIARAQVFTSLSEFDVEKPDCIRLYPTVQDEEAFHQYQRGNRPQPANLNELGVRLGHNSLIEVGDESYSVRALSADAVTLFKEGSEPLTLSHQALLDLKPKIGKIYNAEKRFETLYRESPQQHREEYVIRKAKIKPYLPGGNREGEKPKDRSIRRWRDAYLKCQHDGEPGDLGIFPMYSNSGRKRKVMAPEIEVALKDAIKKHLLAPKRVSVDVIYKMLQGQFGAANLLSKQTVYRRIWEINQHVRDSALGKRYAARSQPIFGDSGMFAPNGERSWQIAHIDSTPVDLALADGESRQHVTLMVDGFDGRILAGYQSEAAPCEAAIRNVLCDCVRRHGTLPVLIICDWGPEHRTVWMQKTLSRMDVLLVYREKSAARQGSAVERTFSSMCRELIHNMQGHTKFLKNARLVTRAVNPHAHAIWDAMAFSHLLDEYCILHNDCPLGGKPSPNALAEASRAKYGEPTIPVPTYEEFQSLLLPFVPRRERKVSERGTVWFSGSPYGVRGARNELLKYAGEHVLLRHDEKCDKLHAFPKDVAKCIILDRLKMAGPARDIIEHASQIDEQKIITLHSENAPARPDDRKAALVTKMIAKETELKSVRKKKSAAADLVEFPPAETNQPIPCYLFD